MKTGRFRKNLKSKLKKKISDAKIRGAKYKNFAEATTEEFVTLRDLKIVLLSSR